MLFKFIAFWEIFFRTKHVSFIKLEKEAKNQKKKKKLEIISQLQIYIKATKRYNIPLWDTYLHFLKLVSYKQNLSNA